MVSSISPVGSYDMGGSYGMSGGNSGAGNVHQQLKEKYGVGYEDFGSRPYARPYPFSMTYTSPKPVHRKSFWQLVLKFCRS